MLACKHKSFTVPLVIEGCSDEDQFPQCGENKFVIGRLIKY